MEEVVRQGEERVAFFKDFYKNVGSYKHYDPDAHYQQFLQRTVKDRDLVDRAVQKTHRLAQLALPGSKGGIKK